MGLPATAVRDVRHVQPVDDRSTDEPEVLPFLLTKRQYKDYRRKRLERHPYCTYCGTKLKAETATLDHIEPVSNGGENAPANLTLACERCNNAKDARSVSTWVNDIIAPFVSIDSIEIWLAGNVPYRSRDLAELASYAVESAGAPRPEILVAKIPLAMFQMEGGDA